MIKDKQKNSGCLATFIIFLFVIVFIVWITSDKEPKSNQPKTLQPNDAQVQWEKEQNDIANEKLKKIWEGIDNGTVTCKDGVCSNVE